MAEENITNPGENTGDNTSGETPTTPDTGNTGGDSGNQGGNTGDNSGNTGGDTQTPNTPQTRVVIDLPTAMYQAVGANLYKILAETIASQVKCADGVTVETRLMTLERAIAANTTLRFANTYDDMNAITGMIPGDKVFVLDATGDETVDKGGAVYVWMPEGKWRKLAEDESMDVICSWEHLQDKPQSPVADIDLAVAKAHLHSNKTELDMLADDGADHLMYKGKRVWDGKVDVACVSTEGQIPENLRDGGILIVNPAGATPLPEA